MHYFVLSSSRCENGVQFDRIVHNYYGIIFQFRKNSSKPVIEGVSINFIAVYFLDSKHSRPHLTKPSTERIWTTINHLLLPVGFFGPVDSPFRNASPCDFIVLSIHTLLHVSCIHPCLVEEVYCPTFTPVMYVVCLEYTFVAIPQYLLSQ